MYLYGASGHAKVIIEILKQSGNIVHGLYDDNPELKELAGIRVLGSYKGELLNFPLIISIGNNRIRAKIASALKVEFGTGIATSAIVSLSSFIQPGTVVMQGAILQADVKIGSHCIINTGATVDHDCILGNYVHVSPQASLCGNVRVGEGTHIGAGATVIPNIRIGAWCTVGAGAVVINDLPDGCTAVGIPARIVKH